MINKHIRIFMAIFFCSTIIKYERRIKSPYPTLLLFSEFRVYLRLALSVHCIELGNCMGSVFTSESEATDNKEFPFD